MNQKCDQCEKEYEEGVTIEFDGYSIFTYCSSQCAFKMMAQELIHGHGDSVEDLNKVLVEVSKEES